MLQVSIKEAPSSLGNKNKKTISLHLTYLSHWKLKGQVAKRYSMDTFTIFLLYNHLQK